MSKRRVILLSQEQQLRLIEMLKTAPKAYLRERAAAILKIAGGMPPAVVAREGLLRRRAADTVYDWVNRFEAKGIQGLYIQPGRGRKPSFFSPSPPKRRLGQDRIARRRPARP